MTDTPYTPWNGGIEEDDYPEDPAEVELWINARRDAFAEAADARRRAW